MRPRRLKLRARFVLLVLAGVAAVTLGIAYVTHSVIRDVLLYESQDHLLAVARGRAAILSNRLATVSGNPRSLAATLEVSLPHDPAELRKILRNHLIKSREIYGMALAFAPYRFNPLLKRFSEYVYRGPDGITATDLDSDSYDYPHQCWYLIPTLLGRAVWTEPYYDDGGGHALMTTYAAPFYRHGKLVGVATADVSLEALAQELTELTNEIRGQAFVLTAQGTFVAAPRPEWVMRETIYSLAEKMKRPRLRRLGRRMVRGATSVVRFTDWLTGRPAWVAFAPVRETGWVFGVVMPEEVMMAPFRRLAKQQVYWGTAGMILMAIVVSIMVLGLTRPLKKMLLGVRRLASGDLSTRVEGIRPGDEVGEMADAFNQMAEDLGRHVEELRTKKAEVEDALNKVALLENISDHMAKFVPQNVRRIIQESPEAPDLEKKARDVTVLFLDIAGYTRMSEEVDSGRMNFLLECYFGAFLDDIYKNKGDINETAGDGLMIIFQHKDPKVHAENAVKTALAVRAKVAEVNDDLEGVSEPVSINIGINSGKAMVGSTRLEGMAGDRWTYTATGSVTNLAARIGAKATNGQIFVGPETAERVRDYFSLEERGLFELKNVSEPLPVFEVVGVKKGPKWVSDKKPTES